MLLSFVSFDLGPPPSLCFIPPVPPSRIAQASQFSQQLFVSADSRGFVRGPTALLLTTHTSAGARTNMHTHPCLWRYTGAGGVYRGALWAVYRPSGRNASDPSGDPAREYQGKHFSLPPFLPTPTWTTKVNTPAFLPFFPHAAPTCVHGNTKVITFPSLPRFFPPRAHRRAAKYGTDIFACSQDVLKSLCLLCVVSHLPEITQPRTLMFATRTSLPMRTSTHLCSQAPLPTPPITPGHELHKAIAQPLRRPGPIHIFARTVSGLLHT